MGKEKRKAEDSEEMEEKIKELEVRLMRKKRKLAQRKNEAGASQTKTVPNVEPAAASQPATVPNAEPAEAAEEIEPQAAEDNAEDLEVPMLEETLPEEFLLALGEEGTVTQEKGENIRPEIVNRWNNIILQGIPKENWPKLLKKYPTPGNFPMAIAPKLNTELTAALSENTLKRDKKFEYRQNLVGKVLSCMGTMLTDIMKGNLNSIKLIEGMNDSAKILCQMNHYDNFIRRHFALSALQNCVKKAVANVPVDTYLFGENLGERLKAAKALERNGSLLQVTAKKQPPKATNAKTNLNWKGPPQKLAPKDNKPRGGPRNHQPYQQYQPLYQQQHYRRPASKPQHPRSSRRH